MITLQGRNVNALWPQATTTLEHGGVEQDSRAGRVRVMPTPVMSVYDRPNERVLMDPVRDANPFFHLMESLWMLAGRDDAAFLNRYAGDFGKRFGDGPDENKFIHGAYGKRWREAFGFDQLNEVIYKLRTNPDDRQCVIQMWDTTDTCYNDSHPNIGHADLLGDWRDRPCNTHVYLRCRPAPIPVVKEDGPMVHSHVLDLTVLCRSNDIVWGAYGANVVHFSVLQEYLAGRIGVGIGKLYQFSNNWHGYVDVLRRFGSSVLGALSAVDPYDDGRIVAVPMGDRWDKWDDDLKLFMHWHDECLWGTTGASVSVERSFYNSWFADMAVPVARVNWRWKMGFREEALRLAELIAVSDWRAACTEWMRRRMK